jgi:Tfp pilus assembly protein PilF
MTQAYLLLLFSLLLFTTPAPSPRSATVPQNSRSSVEQGLEAFRKKDFAAAEQFFRQAVKENPQSALAHKLLGMSFAAREDYKQALTPFRQACDLDSGEENACYYLGRTLYSLSRFDEAIPVFELALKTEKAHGKTLLGLALTLEALGIRTEAEQRYKEAIQAGEKRAMIDYGLFLHKNGRGEESIDLLRKADARAELQRVQEELSAAATVTRKSLPVTPVRFEASPLDMIVKNGARGDKHLIETMMAGVAIFDFDNDGRLDVFVSNGAEIPSLEKTDPSYSNRLFRNLGNGHFEDVTERAGLAGQGYCMGVAAADFDNDGWTDLFVTGVRGNRFYRNQGDGTFLDITKKAGLGGNGDWAVAAGWFDYDNDGWLDLFVVNYVQWDPAKEIHCGGRTLGTRSYCHPKYYAPLPNMLYRNLGNGTFRDVSVESGIAAYRGKGMGVAFGDIDLDGRMDVFVANDTVANYLFRNEGNGKFVEGALQAGVAYNSYGTAISSMGADFRDFDNDGFEDLFVTANSNDMFTLFRNQANGTFVDISGPAHIAGASLPWSGWGLGIFDFNNDGWKDIFTATGHPVDNIDMLSSRTARQPNILFINQGDGTFRVTTLPGASLHRGCAFGDLDGDGRIDIVVTRLNESPLILRNVSEGTGNWVRFKMRGTRSNRDGIGTFIEIETESGRQVNHVTTSVGYGGSSEPAVHFGLGNARKLRKVRVRWPSGTIQELADLEIGRQHEIVEPMH